MEDSDQIRIVLLGKTGCGKSSSGNTLYGPEGKDFKINSSASFGASTFQIKTKCVNGKEITLVDTPAFFDTDIYEKVLKTEMLNCIKECAPGPHVFLIVLRVEKYTIMEEQIISKIMKSFSPEAFKYAIILFTHGDQLPEGTTIEDFVKTNKKLKDLVDKCGGRCHVIDNKYWNNSHPDPYRNNQHQVSELLNTIEKMVRENGGRCYTNEMLQAVNIKDLLVKWFREATGIVGAFFRSVFKSLGIVRSPTKPVKYLKDLQAGKMEEEGVLEGETEAGGSAVLVGEEETE